MIHLAKDKFGSFHVIEVAPNHEVVKSSQRNGLLTRKGMYKNVQASMKQYNCATLRVQDDTRTPSVLMKFTQDTQVVLDEKPTHQPYVLGRFKGSGTVRKTKKAFINIVALPSKKVATKKSAAKKAIRK